MLMDTLLETYRDFTGRIMPVKDITEVEAQQPAANAARFDPSPTKPRRARRLHRSVRAEQRRINGWTVRTW